MIDGAEEGKTARMPNGVPRLLLPADSLSGGQRRIAIAVWTVVVLAWSAFRNGRMLVAWGLPDVQFYMAMAQGNYGLVPQPFSSRPLAPLLARGIAHATHGTLQLGFTVLAYVALGWAVFVVFWLAARSGAPRWVLPAIAVVPFWPQLLGFAGLPDPLYTALLATVLLMLECGLFYAAAAAMLPLMLARESTYLVLLCLLVTCWRQLRWRGSALAVGGALLGAAVVRHITAGGQPNPEHLSGGVYMVGKIVSNSLRSVGLQPWSNVYPYLCDSPTWQTKLSLGSVRSVGLCTWDRVAPTEAVWALLTVFGILPILLVAQWRAWKPALVKGSPLVRFCLVYGGLSLLLAPALGTWYLRLFGYGWPLLLVALPRLLPSLREEGRRSRGGFPLVWGALLLLHLAVCVAGQGYGRPAEFMAVLAFQAATIALLWVQRRGVSLLAEAR